MVLSFFLVTNEAQMFSTLGITLDYISLLDNLIPSYGTMLGSLNNIKDFPVQSL